MFGHSIGIVQVRSRVLGMLPVGWLCIHTIRYISCTLLLQYVRVERTSAHYSYATTL